MTAGRRWRASEPARWASGPAHPVRVWDGADRFVAMTDAEAWDRVVGRPVGGAAVCATTAGDVDDLLAGPDSVVRSLSAAERVTLRAKLIRHADQVRADAAAFQDAARVARVHG